VRDRLVSAKIKVALMGVTGYSGSLLLEILLNHQQLQIISLCSHRLANTPISEALPRLLSCQNQQLPSTFSSPDDLPWEDIDCLFTATPHGVASKLASKALQTNTKLIDLSADFRLKNEETFAQWYPDNDSPNSEHLQQAAYGLTEFNRAQIKDAHILANPGCYPTASLLGIIPLLREGLAEKENIIVDAASGITGAGKKATERLLFGEISESFSAYSITRHRHTPEIEQGLSLYAGYQTKVKFTPHLLPMRQGILATCYLKPKNYTGNIKSLRDCFHEIYDREQFVHLCQKEPSTSQVHSTNNCHIYLTYDERSDWIVVLSAIDNLYKGAAGQAVQNFNLMFNLPESMGLN